MIRVPNISEISREEYDEADALSSTLGSSLELALYLMRLEDYAKRLEARIAALEAKLNEEV